MSSASPNFFGNGGALDILAGTNLVASSRIVEVEYSAPLGGFVGNLWASAVYAMSLGTGSRVVEVSYTAQLGN